MSRYRKPPIVNQFVMDVVFQKLPDDIWTLIFKLIPIEYIIVDKLYLINKKSNQEFMVRYLESIQNRSKRFGIWDELPLTENIMESVRTKMKQDSEDCQIDTTTQIEEQLNAVPDGIELYFVHPIEKLLEIANRVLPSWIRRGDVVSFAKLGNYKNFGKYVWNGVNLVPLDFDHDEYGIVPRGFWVNDFPTVHYFADVISYNTYCWVDLTKYRYVKTIQKPQPTTSTEFQGENNLENMESKTQDDVRWNFQVTEFQHKITGKTLVVWGEPDPNIQLWRVPLLDYNFDDFLTEKYGTVECISESSVFVRLSS